LQCEFIASEARKINEQLRAAENKARLFNSQETLFGVPPTDYSRLRKNVENFEPYSYLWITADDWKKCYQLWMNGSFLNLNPEEVEKNVTSWYKGLFKVSRLLLQKEATACAADCEEIRKQVDSCHFLERLFLLHRHLHPFGPRNAHLDVWHLIMLFAFRLVNSNPMFP
jgi:dynein heavy chain